MVEQLGAIVGPEVRDAAMRRYFKEWSFKHPGPHDFKRVVERESGLELDWYFQDMMHTTNAVDYQVSGVQVQNDSAVIQLARLGDMAMPQDLTLTWDDETTTSVHIPLVMMRGHRALSEGEIWGRLALGRPQLRVDVAHRWKTTEVGGIERLGPRG